MASKKLILVIGATGAQGRAVIDSLLAPAADGTPSPYAVRALTRDAQGKSAKEIAALPDAETFQGSSFAFVAILQPTDLTQDPSPTSMPFAMLSKAAMERSSTRMAL